ncbi:unnamed protein product [Onchocerca ochengi]|uniref:PHB domain-containing protein n=1 Tax=Onchocerca ochengi TaxID=42157 RepID=A0A182EV13_ONCOC|nr:unnamed protein product [Onchocerca ochengi]
MFHHVKIADYHVDLASHGVQPKVLKDSSLWWNGLSWMVHPLERRRKEKFGEEVQERICMALRLTICTEISSAAKTIIADELLGKELVYERIVEVKRTLQGVVKKNLLEEGEFNTLITEIEFLVNERPLVNYERDGEQVLCPGYFLWPCYNDAKNSLKYENKLHENDEPNISVQQI